MAFNKYKFTILSTSKVSKELFIIVVRNREAGGASEIALALVVKWKIEFRVPLLAVITNDKSKCYETTMNSLWIWMKAAKSNVLLRLFFLLYVVTSILPRDKDVKVE